ncbi:MAG: hypothetical protein H6737_23165 [Alphaproteobacteria bacterium]|nr:hypothetical protein [Alphaproteobacteria bacterium]
MLVALASLAIAAPWAEAREAHGCHVTTGADVVPGIPAVRAECHWPTIEPAVVADLVGDVDGQARFVWTLEAESVVRADDEGTWVLQRHALPGLRDREGLVRIERIADGEALEVRWTLEPGPVAADAVAMEANDGVWRVGRATAGERGSCSRSGALRAAPSADVARAVGADPA